MAAKATTTLEHRVKLPPLLHRKLGVYASSKGLSISAVVLAAVAPLLEFDLPDVPDLPGPAAADGIEAVDRPAGQGGIRAPGWALPATALGTAAPRAKRPGTRRRVPGAEPSCES